MTYIKILPIYRERTVRFGGQRSFQAGNQGGFQKVALILGLEGQESMEDLEFHDFIHI